MHTHTQAHTHMHTRSLLSHLDRVLAGADSHAKSQCSKCPAGPGKCPMYSVLQGGPQCVRWKRGVHACQSPHGTYFQEQPNLEGQNYLCTWLSVVLFSLCNHRKFRRVSDFTGLGFLLTWYISDTVHYFNLKILPVSPSVSLPLPTSLLSAVETACLL